MNQLRASILSETDLVAKKQRFGLFSQPPPIAVGDNSLFTVKKADKGEDGKPKTKPRNMLGGTNRSGTGKKSYIQVPESIYQKDPYKDPYKIQLQYQKKIRGKSALHETNFRPASGPKTLANSSYTYAQEKNEKIRKIQRDENGRVKTEPPNILTNPKSKIQDKLFKHVSHMKDEYDRAKQIQNRRRQIWRSNLTGQTMFRSMSHGNTYFNREKSVFGIDDKAKMLISQRKPFQFGKYKRVNHQTKFKLARRGHGDPLGRYPQFMDNRLRIKTQTFNIEKIGESKNDQEKGSWRPVSGYLTRPAPSISLMVKNIRRHL